MASRLCTLSPLCSSLDVKKKPTLKDLQEISNVAITTLPTNGSSRNPSYCETDSWERFRENDNNDAMAAPDSDDRYDNSDPHDFFMDRTMAEEREKPSKKEKKGDRSFLLGHTGHYLTLSVVSRKDPGMIEKKSKKSSDAAHKPKEEQRAFGQERNEAKVKSAEDQLAFSKKPRGVKYDPKTIDDYKKMTTEKYYELGKLQPDLNSEELLMKKANIERVREFSRNLRTINVKQTESAKKKPVIDVKELGKEKSTREKALEFAKKVPKPKTVAKAQSPKEPTPEQPPAQNTNTSARTYTRKGEREPQLSSLEELETLHFQSRQQAAEIRRSLTKSY